MATKLEHRVNKLEEKNNPKGKKIVRFIIKSEEDEKISRAYLNSEDKKDDDILRIIRIHESRWS